MFCPKCGTQLNDNAAFCNACGTQVAPANNANNQTQGYNSAPNYPPYQPPVRQSAPSPLMLGKAVSVKDGNFLFVVIAGILAFFSAFFLNAPVFGMSGGGFSLYSNFSTAHQSSVWQIIFTILTFAAIAYLFLPYIKGIGLKMNILNLVVPAGILLCDFILFIILFATADGSNDLSLSGWMFFLCTIGAIALLVWQTIEYAKSVKR